MRQCRRVFTSQVTFQVARRAEVFRRLLEEVRQARAASTVLIDGSRALSPCWPELSVTRALCEQMSVRTEQDHLVMGRDLAELVRTLIGTLEMALAEVALGALLGPEDDTGQGALGRARRSIERDSAYIEGSIRRQMATLMASSAALAV